jgi:hypothetical protein
MPQTFQGGLIHEFLQEQLHSMRTAVPLRSSWIDFASRATPYWDQQAEEGAL